MSLEPGWFSLAAITGVLCIAAALPYLVVTLLRARPLDSRGLGHRLDKLAATAGVRRCRFLVWSARRRAAENALSVGLLPATRRILLAEPLLRNLGEDEIEAVCAHELGHFFYSHSVYLLVAILASIVPLEVMGHAGEHLGIVLAWGGLLLYLIVVWTLVMPRLSRHFELEADLFGAELVGWRAYTTLLGRQELPAGPRHPTGVSRVGRLEAMENAPRLRRKLLARGRLVRLGILVWMGVATTALAVSLR